MHCVWRFYMSDGRKIPPSMQGVSNEKKHSSSEMRRVVF